MKVIYDRETDTLTVIFAETPVAESDEDKPGVILAVEYKGADRWNGAENDRLIGGLWANLSEGRCQFVMVKDKRWDWTEELLK